MVLTLFNFVEVKRFLWFSKITSPFFLKRLSGKWPTWFNCRVKVKASSGTQVEDLLRLILTRDTHPISPVWYVSNGNNLNSLDTKLPYTLIYSPQERKWHLPLWLQLCCRAIFINICLNCHTHLIQNKTIDWLLWTK